MDKSFVNLTSDEMIDKIDIDPRLIPSFKRVMVILQEYFNSHGYTKERDYGEFFEKYLFNGKFKIQVNDEPSKIGAKGLYQRYNNRICIDTSVIDLEYLDSILCHEFIHFLVKHDLKEGKCSQEIFAGGFINEALTQMLTEQIMGKQINSYVPQVKMMTFVNALAGKTNNYGSFLKGYIDGQGYGPKWPIFVELVEEYHKSFENTSYKMCEALKDDNYIEAQRKVIDAFIPAHHIDSIDMYIEKFNILLMRPVLDFEYFNKLVEYYIKKFIEKLEIKKSFGYDFLRSKMLELSNKILELNKYGNQVVYTFVIDGKEFTVRDDGCLVSRSVEGSSYMRVDDNTTNLKYKDVDLKIDFTKINFNERTYKFEKEIKKIADFFDKSIGNDLIALSKVLDNENLISLKKYKLPIIGDDKGKKSTIIIYIAEYADRIEILNDCEAVGVIKDIDLNRYIGVTSHGDDGLICFDKIGTIDNGLVFTTLNEKRINFKCVDMLVSKFQTELSDEKLTEIIEMYKKTKKYDEDEADSLVLDSLSYYAECQLHNMDYVAKRKLMDEIILKHIKFVVSKDDKINVSLLDGDVFMSLYIASEECLVNVLGDGLYNELYNELKGKNIATENHGITIGISNDELVYDEIDSNYRLNVLEMLYDNITLELEKLAVSDNNDEELQEKLEMLLINRDLIIKSINQISNQSKRKR